MHTLQEVILVLEVVNVVEVPFGEVEDIIKEEAVSSLTKYEKAMLFKLAASMSVIRNSSDNSCILMK